MSTITDSFDLNLSSLDRGVFGQVHQVFAEGIRRESSYDNAFHGCGLSGANALIN